MTKQLHFHFSAFPKKMTDYFKDILGTISLSPIFQNIIYLYLEIDEEKGIYRYQFSSAQSLSCVQLFSTPWTIAYQAPQSMEFSRQEYWSGLPLPSPGAFPHPGKEPGSPALQADALLSEPPGKLEYFK